MVSIDRDDARRERADFVVERGQLVRGSARVSQARDVMMVFATKLSLGVTQRVRRHLVTATATISFDAVQGTLRVGSPAEGAQVNLEQDMLEPTERPSEVGGLMAVNPVFRRVRWSFKCGGGCPSSP